MDVVSKLKPLAIRGDALAAYYLGKYYFSEINDVKESLYWLLCSSKRSCNSASILLRKIGDKYPNILKDMERRLKRDCC
jgi:hypothetical protein